LKIFIEVNFGGSPFFAIGLHQMGAWNDNKRVTVDFQSKPLLNRIGLSKKDLWTLEKKFTFDNLLPGFEIPGLKIKEALLSG
jgi:hypothetical protein